MSKYSRSRLREMALTLLQHKASSSHRYMQFVLTVSLLAGVSAGYVERKINEYAQG